MSVTRRHQDNRAHRATVLVMTLGLLFWQVGGAQAAPRVEISVDDAQVNEGNTITYRVEMTEPPATPDVIPVSVQIWSTAAGANPVRVEMGDMGHHRLWFTEGVERHTLTVRTRRQAATNATSTVNARVESSNRFSITGDATVTAQAVDHAPPSVEAGAGTRSLTMVEGETAQFVIELDDAAQSDLDVNVRTQVTSGAANHYPRLHPSHIGTRTVVIRRGSRRAFVPVTAYDDNAVNHDKVVSLTLLAGTGYTVGSNSTSEATFHTGTSSRRRARGFAKERTPQGAVERLRPRRAGERSRRRRAVHGGRRRRDRSAVDLHSEQEHGDQIHSRGGEGLRRDEHGRDLHDGAIGQEQDLQRGDGQRRGHRRRGEVRAGARRERADQQEHPGRRKLQRESGPDQR